MASFLQGLFQCQSKGTHTISVVVVVVVVVVYENEQDNKESVLKILGFWGKETRERECGLAIRILKQVGYPQD
jgi:hypothetical protein